MAAGVPLDWRREVKMMTPVPMFSSRWFAMLTSIQSVTDMAIDEQKKAKESGGGVDGTLWERSELIVRYMLEEGKLNLMLRLLTDFKTNQRNEKFAQSLAAAKASEPNHRFDDLGTIKIKAALYEQALGLLLSCALCSIESLQTLDIVELLEHLSETLKFSLSHPEMVKSPDAERRQEALAISYLATILEKLEDLPEDRIMDLLQQGDVLGLLVSNITKYHTFYSTETKKKAALALAGFLGTEAYKTTPTAFVTSDEMKKMILGLEMAFVKDLFPDAPSKKTIRPLLDAMAKFKYQVKI